MNLPTKEMETFQKLQYLQIITLACVYRSGKYSKRCKEQSKDRFYEALYEHQGYECFLSNVQALRGHEEFSLFQKDIELFVEKLHSLYRAYKLDEDELDEFDLPKKAK